MALHPRTPPEELVERAADADVVITNKVVLDADGLARIARAALHRRLRDRRQHRRHRGGQPQNIAVTNVPGYSAESVAQPVFAPILHLAQDVAGHSAAVKAGEWARCPDFCFFRRPCSNWPANGWWCSVWAASVARRPIAPGFGMKVIAAAVPGARPAPTGSTWPKPSPPPMSSACTAR